MTSDGFVTGLSFARTRPASIAARARARLSNRPRSTSTTSARFFGAVAMGASPPPSGSWRRRAPFGDETHAGFEGGKVVPGIERRQARRDQRGTVDVEPVDDHQIVGEAKILDPQPLGVG